MRSAQSAKNSDILSNRYHVIKLGFDDVRLSRCFRARLAMCAVPHFVRDAYDRCRINNMYYGKNRATYLDLIAVAPSCLLIVFK